MTSSTHLDPNFKLPKVLPVEVGVISIPTQFTGDSLSEYETFNREVTHLLALLPDEDKANADLDEDEILIHTSNTAALKYACNKYLLNDILTTCHAVSDYLLHKAEGEICEDCIDSFIDQAIDDEYESVVVEGGVVLKTGVLS
jgi:hypothetical protein